MSTAIAGVGAELPPNRYTQSESSEAFRVLCGLPEDGARTALMHRLHTGSTIATRHFALPLERYFELDGFTAANDAFLEVGLELGTQAVARALDDAGVVATEVDLIMSTTVTGIAVPSLDARIASRLGLRPDVRRVPIMGLGCVAGAAGIARVHDYLRGAPDAVAVLVAVELPSLTLQRDDLSVTNLAAAGLFGDGAAAVVLRGAHRAAAAGSGGAPGPRVVDSRSHLYPGTERSMGWDVGSSGFRIVLGAEIPDLVRANLAGDVDALLRAHGLTLADVGTWICHTGGPRILEAIQDVLGLPRTALERTWRSLSEVGNLGSASVLHVLRDTLAERPPTGDGWAVMMAMGPGFCAELVLLRW